MVRLLLVSDISSPLLSYLTTAIRLATSSIVWCLQRPQVMLSWCFVMVESFVICGFYKYTLLASTEFNLAVPNLTVLRPILGCILADPWESVPTLRSIGFLSFRLEV